MRRFFMTIPEAVHLVLEAGGGAAGGELFVLNMGEPVRIVDLAEDLVELSGLRRGEIPIEFTGMRPGEKLDEHLWEGGAQVTPTRNADVLRVFEGQTDQGVDLESGLNRLERAAEASDLLEIQRCLAELIPTFVPGLPRSTAVLRSNAPRS
jgi:FlaA1/EpsC-like NDP-sugar epimerase